MLVFPETKVISTLLELLAIESPTGHAEPAIDYIRHRLEPLGLEMKQTPKGSLIVTVPGENSTIHRLITAHVDTLGAMVKEISSNGRLKLSKIGGYGWFSVEGTYCVVETRKGKRYTGTILNADSSVHVSENAVEQKRTDATIEVRLDAKVQSAEDVKELGIRVGDFVSFDPRTQYTETGFIKSRHLDDKASAAILVECMISMNENGIVPKHTTHFLFSTFEEVGFGGNSSIPNEVREYLAVDMGAVGKGQMSDEYSVCICAKDSSGPYHYQLTNHLIELAEQNGIRFQIDIYPRYGSDASAAMRAGYDVMHALIGPGVDASHAFERTHRDALENTFLLLAHYLLSEVL